MLTPRQQAHQLIGTQLTAGFLLMARDYLVQRYEAELDRNQKRALRHSTFYGFDIVDPMVRLVAVNLYLHGVGGLKNPVKNQDSLASDSGQRFDLILANPPFGKKSSFPVMSEEDQASKEALSCERTDFVATVSNKQPNFLKTTPWKTNASLPAPAPDVLAREILESLYAALAQFAIIAEELEIAP